MPPPKPDVLERPAEPAQAARDERPWLTAAIWLAISLAGVCFALLVLVDRAYGWPAYAAVAVASACTMVRERLRR